MFGKIIAFDLDDVLCYRSTKKIGIDKYHDCKPIPEMIQIVNQCYNRGAKIIIYTARGMTVFGGNVSNIYTNLYQLTIEQLDRWGIEYHQLVMGKVHYDLLIDDKASNSEKIKTIKDIEEILK